MLLTLSTTRQPATDLGWILHKNPANVATFELSFGSATVFWPDSGPDRATCALLVDVDPVGLSRRSARDESRPLEPYVNDRPYVASSFLSVAIANVFGTALGGRSKSRPELVGERLPLEATLDVVPCRGGERLIRALFEPLGYRVEVRGLGSNLFAIALAIDARVQELLGHLYLLVPVLDDEKHYWIGDDEVDKLLHRGEGWLGEHPMTELIVERYLKHQRRLSKSALARLCVDEGEADPRAASGEEALEAPLSLNEARLRAVVDAVLASGARKVVDLGCGEGKLFRRLLDERLDVTGVDVSHRALDIAEERLAKLPDAVKARARLLHGSLVYRDSRLVGFDAATCVEVVEHLDPFRLEAFARNLFGFAAPTTIVLTTPNVEYNPRLGDAARLRHPDHRFEWTRAEFEAWANKVASDYGYAVVFSGIGPVDAELGAPTQMGVFTRCA